MPHNQEMLFNTAYLYVPEKLERLHVQHLSEWFIITITQSLS